MWSGHADDTDRIAPLAGLDPGRGSAGTPSKGLLWEMTLEGLLSPQM
jgi:hypothetical protein